DLGVFHRHAHVVRGREAAVWSVVWITLALSFNLGIYLVSGANRGLEFFLAAFSYFAVPEELQHRVLFWGILGALLTRGVFIAVGAALLATFHWVTYIFGAFLLLTGGRLLFGGDEEVHPEKNPVLKLFRRFVRTTPDYEGPRFFLRRDGRLWATPLLMVLVVIEASDVVFAVDSIPAVFGVTRDVFIVYTSNIFAVLGLRALLFLVARLVKRLRYLKPALALVLAFVGAKMLVGDKVHISDLVSLGVVAGLILA